MRRDELKGRQEAEKEFKIKEMTSKKDEAEENSKFARTQSLGFSS